MVTATPSRWARWIAIASPTARGRCEAIVEVCGITDSAGWPKTLCRPPAMGSSAPPIRLCSMSRTGLTPVDLGGAGDVERAGSIVQQGGVGGPRGQRDGGVGLVPRRADRVVAAADGLQLARHRVEMPTGGLGVERCRRSSSGEPASRRWPSLRGSSAAMLARSASVELADRVRPATASCGHPSRRNVVSGVSSATSIWAFCSRPE